MPYYYPVLPEKQHFKNINRIFPTAQLPVYQIIEALKEDSSIKRIIIFGSAVENRFDSWYKGSDIDVYIDAPKGWKYTVGNLHKVSTPVDLIYPDWPDEALMKEILSVSRKGVRTHSLS